ncbi:PQQ-dependent sugar dehydrogenase [Actinokineospora bangkokensis]|uniref:Gluconolaconase n=1 Tax=Actinokineospora bangkokensis TaxID=1193682 RepID=A0A1Q9LN71_9PSEU|nr:gluconolaconase [Actinokineospora bangkokensis]OLR93496.1 gluconolaconase [Actinokineospora bangkokensis]
MPVRRSTLATAAAVLLLSACGTAPDAQSAAVRPAAPRDPATVDAVRAPTAANAAALVPVTLTVPSGMNAAPFDVPRQALVPQGWTLSVYARLKAPRLAAWAPDGTLLVSVPQDGTVRRVSANGAVTTLLSGLNQPHGLAFAGSGLFLAQSNRVDAYTYSQGTAVNPVPIAVGLPDAKSPELGGQYAHALKSVAIGQDGAVYISVGSTGNISTGDLSATPPRASILRVPPGGGPTQPFAVGVRNGTGLAVAPDGAVWTAVNNRDNIQYPFNRPYGSATGSSLGQVIPDYVRDHPAEPLAKLTQGRNLGWPYCNPDPDVNPGVKGTAFDYSAPPFTRDQETNPTGAKLNCSTLAPVEQSLGGHSAPLGLSFTTTALPAPYARGALVGVHGSWNASPPRAPEVSFFTWANGSLGDQQTLVGGFQSSSGARWGRPVAAVQGPDRAIYITDDQAGAIYRLVPPAA